MNTNKTNQQKQYPLISPMAVFTVFTALLMVLMISCSSKVNKTDPTDVILGETTFVIVVNPLINDLNDVDVPQPGIPVDGVLIDGGSRSATTGPEGIGVLGSVAHGAVTLRFRFDSIDEDLTQSIRERDLVELAVSLSPDGAFEMARVVYEFGAEVVELSQDNTLDEVNNALSASDRIVLLTDGIYSGDLELSGSNVTLFGAGVTGGRVTIEGNVTISGSGNRIRGAYITGDLDVSGSDAGVSFSAIDGSSSFSGSDSVLLHNTFCGDVQISGSSNRVLGNAGIDPIEAVCP